MREAIAYNAGYRGDVNALCNPNQEWSKPIMAKSIIIPEGAKAILLTNSDNVALVDESDFGFLSHWNWYLTFDGYVARNQYISYINGVQKSDSVLMHRIILGTPKGMQGDHKDGNRLDNRRLNLRNSTHGQNQQNRGANKSYAGRGSTSKYKGVSLRCDGKKWCASIMSDRKRYYLGSNFSSEVEAALAYNKAAKELHGEFAYMNKIES